MGILSWVVVGLVAGWLAGLVIRGGGYGLAGDIIIGIIGALVGGFLAASVLGLGDPISGINPTTVIVAFLGAIVVSLIVRALTGPRAL